MVPELVFANRQRSVRFDSVRVAEEVKRALPLILKSEAITATGTEGSLGDLEEVSVVFVSDRKIAELHSRYMEVSGATDVITFQHGEIVVSVDTAAEAAHRLGVTPESELVLYVVHGLLHLNGYDDIHPEDRARMHRRQDEILASVRVASSSNTQ